MHAFSAQDGITKDHVLLVALYKLRSRQSTLRTAAGHHLLVLMQG